MHGEFIFLEIAEEPAALRAKDFGANVRERRFSVAYSGTIEKA